MLRPLLIILLPMVLGCMVGILAGKHRVKKLSGQLKPILTGRQRIIYSASVLFGVACLLVGFLYTPGVKDGDPEGDNYPIEIPATDDFYGGGDSGEIGILLPEGAEGEVLTFDQAETPEPEGDGDEAQDVDEDEAQENEADSATGNSGGVVAVSPARPSGGGGTVRFSPGVAIRMR